MKDSSLDFSRVADAHKASGGATGEHVLVVRALSGHWAPEGAGSFRTMTSGVNTAQLVLSRAGGPSVPSFKRAGL